MPRELNRKKSTEPIAKLVTMQNKCLKAIIRVYKVTNIKILETEMRVISFNLNLNQTVLQ